MASFALLPELLAALEDDTPIKIIYFKDEIEKTCSIPRGILRTASPWFANALAPNTFAEGRDNTLRFPETDPDVVEQALFYIVRGYLPRPASFSAAYADATPSKADAVDRKLFREIEARQLTDVRIWAFGEQYLLPHLQQLAMRRLYNLLASQYPSIDTIREAYATAPQGSTLRKIMMFETVAGYRNKLGEGKESLPGYTPKDLENLSKESEGFMEDFARVAGQFMPEMKATEGAAAFGIDAFLTKSWSVVPRRKL